MEEKYSLAFLSPVIFDLINTKRFTVVEELRRNDIEMGSNFIVSKRFNNRQTFHGKRLPPLSSIIFKCEEIFLGEITIFPQEFLHLLSIKVRHNECIDVRLCTTLTFSDILKAAPNIEHFNFCDTNIETGKSWPEDILKWKNGRNLQYLKIQITSIYFNVRSLVKVIKEKSANDVEIFLDIYCYANLIGGYQITFEILSNRMSTYFIAGENFKGRANIKICLLDNNGPFYRLYFTMP